MSDSGDTPQNDRSELPNHEEMSALQGLLSRLGGGIMFEEMMHMHLSSSRIKQMIAGIETGLPDQMLCSLNELCDALSVSTEENISPAAVEALVAALVPVIAQECSADVELLAVRALSNLMEAMPPACGVVANSGAPQHLCAKLLSIEFIDLAEESLRAIEKLSVEHSRQLFECNAMMAVLAYFDFFGTAIQRSALQTVANMCGHARQSNLGAITDSISQLAGFLSYGDPKLIELASISFERLANAFKSNENDVLEQVLPAQAVRSLVGLLRSPVSLKIHSSVTFTLRTACENSPNLERECVGADLIETISEALKSDILPLASQANSAQSRSASQTHEVLFLADKLLPEVPRNQSTSETQAPPPTQSEPETGRSSRTPRRRRLEASEKTESLRSRSTRSHRPPAVTSSPPPKSKSTHVLLEKPDLLTKFGEMLFETLLEVYDHNINPKVRSMCLGLILKIAHFSSSEGLAKFVAPLRVSAFVAGLLCLNDAGPVCEGVRITEELFMKLPKELQSFFHREGVIHHCEKLANQTSPWHWAGSNNKTTQLLGCLLRAPFIAPLMQSSSQSSSVEADVVGLEGSDEQKQEVEMLAKRLLRSNFAQLPPESQEYEILTGLKEISSSLLTGELDQATSSLRRLAELLASPSGVTVFELVSSGVISSVITFLNSPPTQTLFARVKTFVEVRVDAKERESEYGTKSPTLILLLVRALQKTLVQVEQYPLFLHGSGGALGSNGGDSIASMKALTQPFKLRLQRIEGDTIVKEHSSSPVMIEALASILAIEDFLAPKVAPVHTPSVQSSARLDLDDDDFALPQGSQSEKKKTRRVASFSAKSSPSPGQDESESDSKQPTMESVCEAADANDDNEDMEDEEEEDDDDDDDGGMLGQSESPFHSTNTPVIDVALAAHTPSSTASPPARPILPSPRSSPSPRMMGRPNSTPATPVHPSVPQHNLVLFYEGMRLDYHLSIYQVLHHFALTQGERSLQSMWQRTHTIQYCSVDADLPQLSLPPLELNPSVPLPLPALITQLMSEEHQTEITRLVPVPSMFPELPSDATREVLFLLRVLNDISANWRFVVEPNEGTAPPLVAPAEFVSARLTTKLARQLDDPLTLCAASLPKWCSNLPIVCPFLFGFDTRVHRLIASAFGTARSLHAFQTRQSKHVQEASTVRIARIQRQKVRVNRTKILESAMKVMNLYASSKAMLEIEFFDEVGTGTGPTMEFFTLVANKLKEKTLTLWIDSAPTSESPFVECPLGLYPRPCKATDPVYVDMSRKQLTSPEMFHFIGQLVAKSMVDSRLVELPLNDVFVKLVRGDQVFVQDLIGVAPEVAKTLSHLQGMSQSYKNIRASDATAEEQEKQIAAIWYGNTEATLDDLCLSFCLPSDSNFELIPGGNEISVTLDNLDSYIEALVDAHIGSGVRAQVLAFREGFSTVFSIHHLQPFSVNEVEILVCGEHRQLSLQALRQHTKADHGYTINSTAIQTFFEIVEEMDAAAQRRLIMFITGSPRLPVGGLATLNPRLTIVRKTPEQGRSADEYLPSVMTCANYLKLPDYSSKEVMRNRLELAISDGQGSFHLS
eukprot:c16608_g1_i1.p1 GENE.c16608_g1_i1~~c16608_g1_i1.p1  ORF type:complete len:1572 (+),score=317.42 c16608_g1_i1:1741-6456(+)